MMPGIHGATCAGHGPCPGTGHFTRIASVVIALAGLAGCSTQPKLLITEVDLYRVELYLDQRNDFPLDRITLDIATTGGHQGSVSLLGSIPGQGFLVVFEDATHSGPPVSERYLDPLTRAECTGIKVAAGTIGLNLGDSLTLRLAGDSGRGPGGIGGLFHSRWSLDDTVSAGPRPRPVLGGYFVEDTTTSLELHLPPIGISRSWQTSGPVDNNRESDWLRALATFCNRT